MATKKAAKKQTKKATQPAKTAVVSVVHQHPHHARRLREKSRKLVAV